MSNKKILKFAKKQAVKILDKKRKKSLEVGSIIAIARPDAIYITKVIRKQECKIEGQCFDTIIFDDIEELSK